MENVFVHLSDIHFRENWHKNQTVVMNSFFNDLSKQIENVNRENIYIIFTGDIVLSGGNKKLYDIFFDTFDTKLNEIKIPKTQRICIPGNHDISREFISNNYIEHEGVISQKLKEKEFNDYLEKKPEILHNKFNNYIEFEKKFAMYGVCDNVLAGHGVDLNNDIGLFLLNSAVCSSGGHNSIDDKGRLNVNTREINKWIINNKTKLKVLIMHHPLDWLTEDSRNEIEKLAHNNFNLLLSGHNHNQSAYHLINKDSVFVKCSAPQLFTTKHDFLGYTIINIFNKNIIELKYRQWTKNNNFVTGVNFSNNDDGKIIIAKDDEKKRNNIQNIK